MEWYCSYHLLISFSTYGTCHSLEIQYSLKKDKTCLTFIKWLAYFKGNMQSLKKVFFLWKTSVYWLLYCHKADRSSKYYWLLLSCTVLIVYVCLILKVVFYTKDALILCAVCVHVYKYLWTNLEKKKLLVV